MFVFVCVVCYVCGEIHILLLHTLKITSAADSAELWTVLLAVGLTVNDLHNTCHCYNVNAPRLVTSVR